MSRIFGPIRQNGYVVRDLEAAVKHWTEVLHVGPFFWLEHVEMEDFRYRGEPSPVEISLAFSNSGPLQIELIQQHNDAPSMYREFLDAGREGLQHLAYWTPDYDAMLKRAEQAGFVEGQAGRFGVDGRFVYFANEGHPGTVVELSEVVPGGLKDRFFRAIADAAESWDGVEAVKRISMRG